MAQAGAGKAQGLPHIWARLAMVGTPRRGWRVASPGTVPGVSWMCASGWGQHGTVGDTAPLAMPVPAPTPLSAAVDEKSMAQLDPGAWVPELPPEPFVTAGWQCCGGSSVARGRPGTPSSDVGRPRGRWGPVPPLHHTYPRVPCPRTHVPCPRGRAVPSCAVGSPTRACPAAHPPECAAGARRPLGGVPGAPAASLSSLALSLHKRPRGGHGRLPPRRHRRHPDSI